MQNLKILFLFGIFVSLTACRTKNDDEGQKQKESTEFFSSPPEKVTELSSNRLANEPSNFLREQATSPIKWQPWTNDILHYAERSQRLIFVFVGSTNYSNAQTLLQLLESKFATEINENYVPVLADIELDPTLALACNMLVGERREPIAFPFLMWLSHEGNPVAWVPIMEDNEESLLLGFRRAQNTVEAIVNKSPRYVVENSRYDNDFRLERIAKSLDFSEEDPDEKPTRGELFIAAQSLTDLYDSVDKTFDNTGGIPPGNLITSLARISAHPATPNRLKTETPTACKEALELLVESAIHDPLDGYFFSRRNSRSFAVPALSKNLKTQAEMLSALSSSQSTPASARATAQMLEALAQNPLNVRALHPGEVNELAFFWSTGAIEDLLTDDEMLVAKAAFELKALGNVPSSDDPRRIYFRRNTLGLKHFGSDLARRVKKNEGQTEELLASAIQKLAARRDEILEVSDALLTEDAPTLGPKARLLTALARTYAASPKDSTLQQVNSVGEEILTNFTDSKGQLVRTPIRENFREAPAFAYDYVATIEALLEWYRVSWNSELLDKAEKLTNVLLDNFLDENNKLVEVKTENYPLTFPIYNDGMTFGPSTWGLSHGVLNRMLAMGNQHPKLPDAINASIPRLQIGVKRVPVIHTDYLLTAFNNLDGYLLLVGEGQKNNNSLRLALAQPRFDSVCTVLNNPNLKGLPSVGNNAAILVKNGKKVKTFASSNAILADLRSQLAKN